VQESQGDSWGAVSVPLVKISVSIHPGVWSSGAIG